MADDRAASGERISDEESLGGLDGLREAVGNIQSPQEERRLIFAKGENYRHIRHAQILARWPVLAEPWARRIEHARVTAVDRTPAAATFGR